MAAFLTKKNAALYIFLFINFLFGLKYLSRITVYALIFALVVTAIQLLLWKKRDLLKTVFKHEILNVLLLVIFILLCSLVFIKIPVLSLNVDRATVISSFWENYFRDEYVYFARSHMDNLPGPMPFYYILALPFYLIGELGYFSLTGIIALYMLLKMQSYPVHIKTVVLLIVLSSFFYIWEVVCRSNVFINGMLIVFSLLYFFREHKKKKYFIVFSGIIFGLLLSTRNVFAIPYIIAFIYALRLNRVSIIQVVQIGFISVITFTVTFLPFVLPHIEDFKQSNPFIIQGTYLMPFGYTLFFVGAAFAFGFFCKKVNDVYFYSAFTLFLTVVGYHLYHIYNTGWHQTFYESKADISYFILCIPFLIYYIISDEKPLNKIIN